MKIKYGIEKIIETGLNSKHSYGIVCNQASITSYNKYSHLEILKKADLKYIFSPQHGFYGTEQANMIETGHSIDIITKIPVISLYSETRKIPENIIRNIDAIIFDIQDVGSRYYTYLWTLYYCMEICSQYSKKIIVADRPAIINGIDIEGSGIDKGYESFVGLHSIPNRFALTMAEFALLLKKEKFPDADIEIAELGNWERHKYSDEYTNIFIPPSPNIPDVKSAVVYPGTCLFEGTGISEGRGTTRPFEIIGAPFIEPEKLIKELNFYRLEGVYFRPVEFKPVFDKFKNEVCRGIFIHVTERQSFRPLKTSIAILKSIKKLYDRKFSWFLDPYEYENNTPAIDLLYGNSDLRNNIDSEKDISEIFQRISENTDYKKRTEEVILYK